MERFTPEKKVLYKPKQDAYNAYQFLRGTEQRPQVLPFRGTRVSVVILFSIFMDMNLRHNFRIFRIVIILFGAILWFSGPIASHFPSMNMI